MESECFAKAAASIVLCKSDQKFVLDHFGREGHEDNEPLILFPHIRQDVVDIPPLNKHLDLTDSLFCFLPSEGDATNRVDFDHIAHLRRSRPYFTCCVRLAPEKEPHRCVLYESGICSEGETVRFVDIVIEMERRDLFDKFSLRPLMCGSLGTDYAQACLSFRSQATTLSCF